MSKKLSGKGLVIQLSSDKIRIAKTNLGAAMPQLQASFVADLPEGAVEDGVIHNLEAVSLTLQQALTDPELRRIKRAVFVLCTTQVIAEQTTMPQVAVSKLDKMLEANMDMYFPVDTQNYHLAWQLVDKKNENGEMVIQMWAVSTAIVRPYYALANDCGLSVVAIDYCGHALATAVDASFAVPAGSKKKTSAASVLNKPLFSKKKNGETPDEELSAPVAVADEPEQETQLYLMAEDEHLLMLFVQDGQVKLQRMALCSRNPNMETELGEVLMALDYFESTSAARFNSVNCILCGELAESERFIELTRDVLNIPVQVLPALNSPAWTLCLGAASTTLDFGIPGLNHPGGVGQINNAWQYGLILVGGAALALSLVATFGSKGLWAASINGLESQKNTLQIQAAQNANYAQNYHDYESAYQRYSSDWDTIFGSLRTYNDNLVLMFNELEETLPKKTSVVGIQIADQALSLELATPTKEEAAYTIMALRKLQYATLPEHGISDLVKPTYEQAPTVGGPDLGSLLGQLGLGSLNGSSSLEDMLESLLNGNDFSAEEIVQRLIDLPPEQFDALEEAYGTHPTPNIKMADLLKEADFNDRKKAFEDMFSADPFAIYRFYQLFLIDNERPVRDMGDGRTPAVLHGDIYDALFEQEDLIDSILSGDAVDFEKAIDSLVACLTLDNACLTSAEKLMSEDSMLYDRYAFYLAVALGYEKPMDSPIDIDALIRDLFFGTLPDMDNKEDLEDALGSLLPNLPNIGDKNDNNNLPGGMDIGSLLDQLLGGGGTSSMYPQFPTQPVDDRWHFNVSLGYKPDLIAAERERKGLDYDAKIQPLDVEVTK